MATRKTISRGIVVLIFLAILGYAYFEARPYLSGPQLEVITPQDGFVTAESPIAVSGKASRISEITLNGNPIFVDENGLFERLVPLSEGYAVVQVSVKDRFGRSKTVTVRGTYTPAVQFPSPIQDTGTSSENTLDAGTTTDAL